jgi:hypothetical protein
MRYVYSVLRFVPDPVRGEFINVGAIVGSEEASEWKIRLIDNYRRARMLDDKGVLTSLWHFVDEIGKRIDNYEAYIETHAGPPVEVSESWLRRLWGESQNVIQFSPPTPFVATNAEEVLDSIFRELIVDPESRRFPFQKKNVALAAIRRAYQQAGIRQRTHFQEAALVQGRHHRERFDFAVMNGPVLQLAHAWSFQIPKQDELAEDIKAWAWTVRDLRRGGGKVQSDNGAEFVVPENVDVEVVYVAPLIGGARTVLDEALSAFQDIDARAIDLGRSTEVGRRAQDLLRASGAQLQGH